MTETNYQLMRRQGVSRRSFLKFCSLTAASLGLGANGAADIAHAMETKPRTPVIWLHGLECTCCTESFIRSYHPLTKDVILSMISLAYDDTLMVAAGEQDHQALEDVMKKFNGNYILAVEGSPCLGADGMFCLPGGKPFLEKLMHVAKGAKAVIAWGSCSSWGCINTAKPNPTKSVPITDVIKDKPIIRVPGCPPIPEVMTGVITYMLTYDRLPPVDAQLRPKMFYGQRNHAALTSTQVSSLKNSTTSAPNSATASTRSAARDLSPTTPALLSVGTTCCLGRLNPDIRAWPAPKTTSGIRAASTLTNRPSCLRAGVLASRLLLTA